MSEVFSKKHEAVPVDSTSVSRFFSFLFNKKFFTGFFFGFVVFSMFSFFNLFDFNGFRFFVER